MSTHVMENCYSQFYGRHVFFFKKPASQIWWTWRNSFPQKTQEIWRTCPSKWSLILTVSWSNQLQNTEILKVRHSKRKFHLPTIRFQGLIMLVYRSVALEILKHVGIVFSQIFSILGTEDVKMFLICGRRKRRCTCSDVCFLYID